MRFGRIPMMVCFCVLGLLAAACAKTASPGSTGSSSPPVASSSTPTASVPVALSGVVTNKGTKDLSSMGKAIHFSLEADNDGGQFYFNPTFLKITPGATVTVELENEGNAKHNFTIKALHVDQDLAPGQKKTITFTLPSSGAVGFFCEYHHGLGMQGAFFSTAGEPLVSTSTSSGSSTTSGSSTGYGY